MLVCTIHQLDQNNRPTELVVISSANNRSEYNCNKMVKALLKSTRLSTGLKNNPNNLMNWINSHRVKFVEKCNIRECNGTTLISFDNDDRMIIDSKGVLYV